MAAGSKKIENNGEEQNTKSKLAESEGVAEALFSVLRKSSRSLTNLYNDLLPNTSFITENGQPLVTSVKMTQLVVLQALYDTSWWDKYRFDRLAKAEKRAQKYPRKYKDIVDAYSQEGAVVQVDLADYLELDCTTLCRNLKSLQECRWVTRSSCSANQREALISLTAEGRRVVEASQDVEGIVAQSLKCFLGNKSWNGIIKGLSDLHRSARVFTYVNEQVTAACRTELKSLLAYLQQSMDEARLGICADLNSCNNWTKAANWEKNFKLQALLVICEEVLYGGSVNHPYCLAEELQRALLSEKQGEVFAELCKANEEDRKTLLSKQIAVIMQRSDIALEQWFAALDMNGAANGCCAGATPGAARGLDYGAEQNVPLGQPRLLIDLCIEICRRWHELVWRILVEGSAVKNNEAFAHNLNKMLLERAFKLLHAGFSRPR